MPRSLLCWVTTRRSQAVLRVSALAACLGLGSLFALVSAAAAKGDAALGQLAEHALQIPDGNYPNTARRISINGFQLAYETGYAKVDFDRVSEQFASICRERSGMLGEDAGQVQLRNWVKAKGDIFSGVHVTDTERGRILACVDTHGVSWFSQTMLKQLREFAKSGDLRAIGTFRYALVKKTSYGAHFVTFWTEGAAPILRMFPAQGDAPGPDHRALPRVQGSRRVLSVVSEQLQTVTFEHATQTAAEVIPLYEAALRESGLGTQVIARSTTELRSYVQNGATQSLLVVTQAKRGVVANISDIPE